jgi:hypothetical protein
MPDNANDDEQLQAALGTPKYYLDAEGKKAGERYYWFPTQGNSMTDTTDRSIPSGSLVLGRLIHVQTVQDIPLHRPLVVIIDDGGQQFCMLKSACDISTGNDSNSTAQFCLHSYNPQYNNFWLPFSCVKFMFEVERVRRPDGSEFEW